MLVRRIQILVAVTVMAFTCACAAKRDYRETLAQSHIQSPEQAPLVVAAYQPWFGRNNHINVGYNSQDPARVKQQLAEAKNLGIQGFVINWYGPRHPFEDKAYNVVQEAANQS